MSAPAAIEDQDGRVILRGSITLENVETLLDQARERIGDRQLRVDFSGVNEADSAAVALMLAWTRAAAARGHGVAFENCPASLRTLVALYDVGDLITCG